MLLEKGGSDTVHSCEAEVESDRGGGVRTDTASEREGEAPTVKGTGTASVPAREALVDRSLCVGDEESEGRG